MRKIYCYIFICLVAAFGFTITANAATSTVQQTIPVKNGNNLTAYTQSYTDIYAEDIGAVPSDADAYGVFKPTFNLQLYGMNQRYLNGYFVFSVNVNCSISGYVGWSYDGIEYTRPYNTDGLSVYVAGNAYNYFNVYVIFDNYWNESGSIDLGTVTQKHQVTWGDVSPFKASFTTSISVYSNNVERDEYITNNRTTELLYNAIYQATGEQLTNIITSLNTIKNQDPVYYNQIITSLTAINSTLGQTNTNLLNILNELDLDFAAVQTILDLFPSYRTQVLQYWQELLQMNAAQSSAAAEMESEYANRDNESNQLLGGLDSIQFPSVSSGDLNVLKNVDADGKANFFGLISLITNNSLITNILLIVVTGMIAGYALYGKK